MWFFTPPLVRRLTSFARLAHSPRSRLLCAPGTVKCGPFGGVVPPDWRLRSGLRSSNRNPKGNCVGWRVETSRQPDSTRLRFLIAPRRSAPEFVFPPVTKPAEELVIYACCSRNFACRGAADTSCRQPFPGRPGLSQSRSQPAVSGRCTATVLSRNGMRLRAGRWIGKAMFCTTFSPSDSVNILGVKSLTGYSQACFQANQRRPRGANWRDHPHRTESAIRPCAA